MVIGAAGELPKPPAEPIKFLEDMNDTELADVVGRTLNAFTYYVSCPQSLYIARHACWSYKVSFEYTCLSSSVSCCAYSLGNTCYMSATIQALRAIPELQTALAEFAAQRHRYWPCLILSISLSDRAT